MTALPPGFEEEHPNAFDPLEGLDLPIRVKDQERAED